MPQLTPVIGNGGITASVLSGDLRINRKALVDRKVKPKFDDVEEKLRKVREDIRRLETGYGGDLDKIAEELAVLQDNMKFDELKKDMKMPKMQKRRLPSMSLTLLDHIFGLPKSPMRGPRASQKL